MGDPSDILAAILGTAKADAPPAVITPTAPQPRPWEKYRPAVESWPEMMFRMERADPVRWGRIMSSWDAARAFAEHYGLSFEDVRGLMARLPENLWHLLDSPQGWSLLAEQVAIMIEGELYADPLKPIVH